MADTDPIQHFEWPVEIAEHILSALVEDLNYDPALQWTRCRHLSGNQMRQVERHFRDFWLPKLVVTLYYGPHFSVDYRLFGVEKRPFSDSEELDIAHFRTPENEVSTIFTSEVLTKLWKENDVENPCTILRLGEGYLKDGLRGSYIINDTELPELQVDDSGTNIRFEWRGALDQLLREEILLRKYHDDILAQKVTDWRLKNDWPTSEIIPRNLLLKFLVYDVQMQKRVAVRRHRSRRHDPSGRIQPTFNEASGHLHGEIPTLTNQNPRGGCFCCTRMTPPDIFEVIFQEESMAPLHSEWNALEPEEMLDLFAEEFGWHCCRVQGKDGNSEFQQARKGQWKNGGRNILRDLTTTCRWDMLG